MFYRHAVNSLCDLSYQQYYCSVIHRLVKCDDAIHFAQLNLGFFFYFIKSHISKQQIFSKIRIVIVFVFISNAL